MRYKLLGGTGLRVAELALGTMTFGPDWGWGADKDVARAMFDAFAEAGGNAASAIELGFPYDFIRGGRESFMGAVSDQVDDHRRTVV